MNGAQSVRRAALLLRITEQEIAEVSGGNILKAMTKALAAANKT